MSETLEKHCPGCETTGPVWSDEVDESLVFCGECGALMPGSLE